jgi:large subunit ribosomal protein L4
MAKVTVYNQLGEKAGDMDLEKTLFEAEVNEALVHEAVVAQQANSREVIAHTKDRGAVSGGGKKPWKQKGTGRARHGSIRSPLWVGGGVTFGPTKDRNFSVKMNKKARRKALAMVLSDKVAGKQFVVVENLEIPEGKTKTLSDLMNKLPLSGKKTLLVLEKENKNPAIAAGNIQNLDAISAQSLNVVDLLAHQTVVVTKAAVESIAEMYKQV